MLFQMLRAKTKSCPTKTYFRYRHLKNQLKYNNKVLVTCDLCFLISLCVLLLLLRHYLKGMFHIVDRIVTGLLSC